MQGNASGEEDGRRVGASVKRRAVLFEGVSVVKCQNLNSKLAVIDRIGRTDST